MKVLGIDPGFGIVGWAVAEKDFKLVSYGTINTLKEISIEGRLTDIHYSLKEIIKKYKPDSAALERLFFSKNTKTAIDVAKAKGVIQMTLHMEGLSPRDYSPVQVKSIITGYGRASKEQMQKMIQKIYKLDIIPAPDDAADALAIATCHLLSSKAL